jgi:hypothetical protein
MHMERDIFGAIRNVHEKVMIGELEGEVRWGERGRAGNGTKIDFSCILFLICRRYF